MDKDRNDGSINNTAGKIESGVGAALGDQSVKARAVAGDAQDIYGQAKDAARDVAGAAVSYARQFQDETLAELVRKNPRALAHLTESLGIHKSAVW